MEKFEESRPDDNEETSHQDGSDDPEKKNALLILLGYLEVRKYQHEYEKVVDGERVFDEVARKKVDGRLGAEMVVNKEVEKEGCRNPNTGKNESLR